MTGSFPKQPMMAITVDHLPKPVTLTAEQVRDGAQFC